MLVRVANNSKTKIWSVPQEADLYKTKTTSKTREVAYLIFSILFFPVGMTRLIVHRINKVISRKCVVLCQHEDLKPEETQEADEKRNQFSPHSTATHLKIHTADDIALDAMEIHVPNSKNWIVFFCSNQGTYEVNLDFYNQLSQDTQANILCFNYRGVMQSQGSISSSHDLVLDGEAMVQYLLKKKGIPEQNIMLHGYSLGGGVATEVASLHPSMHLCNDRSFSNFVDAGIGMKVKGIAAKILRPLAHFLARAMGWTFNSSQNIKKVTGKKIVIYGKQDEIIDFPFASLYKAIDKDDNLELIELKYKKCHCKPLSATAYQAYIKAVQSAFNGTGPTSSVSGYNLCRKSFLG